MRGEFSHVKITFPEDLKVSYEHEERIWQAFHNEEEVKFKANTADQLNLTISGNEVELFNFKNEIRKETIQAILEILEKPHTKIQRTKHQCSLI